jgi:hypothetical protein
MPGAHRDRDLRFCDAETLVSGQSSVWCNGQLWAVKDDECDHGDGQLIPVVGNTVFINGKLVIVAVGDTAECDDLFHCPPDDDPKGHSSDVFAYS